MKRGKILIVSGPSGAGKSTVVQEFLRRTTLDFHCSVSSTTRSARRGEVDGVNYHFISPEQFLERQRQGLFLESFQVFGSGAWYGTSVDEVEPYLSKGTWVLLEIDVRGAAEVRRRYGSEALSVFISPGSLTVLEQRLRGRQTETEEQIAVRLKRAEEEMRSANEYNYTVINNAVAQAADAICQIVAKEA